jgi:hypothetical protein
MSGAGRAVARLQRRQCEGGVVRGELVVGGQLHRTAIASLVVAGLPGFKAEGALRAARRGAIGGGERGVMSVREEGRAGQGDAEKRRPRRDLQCSRLRSGHSMTTADMAYRCWKRCPVSCCDILLPIVAHQRRNSMSGVFLSVVHTCSR